MIITCENCSKTFDVKDELIPEKGRMLKCSKCEYKWFFKKKIENKLKNLSQAPRIDRDKENKNLFNKTVQTIETKNISKNVDDINLNKTKYNFFKIFVVIIISIIGLIVILDTFKNQLTPIIPNLSEILNNLYESLTDLKLFIKDLIK